MVRLTKNSKARLRRAARARNDRERKIVEAKKAVLDDECKRFSKRPEGRYGILPKAGKPGFSGDDHQAVVDQAWALLKKLATPRLRTAIDAYEEPEGPPRFDVEGRKVSKRVGGTTITRWRYRKGVWCQIASFDFCVGARFISCKKRTGSDYVQIAVLRTLLHELAGHWSQVGQKVKVDPSLSRSDRLSERRRVAEKRADRITSKLLKKLKKSKLYKKCLDDLEAAFQKRLSEQKKLIQNAIDAQIEKLS